MDWLPVVPQGGVHDTDFWICVSLTGCPLGIKPIRFQNRDTHGVDLGGVCTGVWQTCHPAGVAGPVDPVNML